MVTRNPQEHAGGGPQGEGDELGAHVSAAGGTPNAPARAEAIGARVLQLFTKQPNRWAEPVLSLAVGEAFASERGADFFGLPRNEGTVTLERQPWQVAASYPFGDDVVVPLRAGEEIAWRVVGIQD